MSDKQSKKSVAPWGLLALMAVMAGAGAYIVKAVLSGESPRKKSSISIVTLLKPPPPPPPPQVKAKPPEPEQVQKKEEVLTQVPQDEANPDSKPAANQPAGEQDNTPAGDNLGLDAEGTAGGDAFGLVGKKGGRSLLAGGGGSGGMGKLSALARFAGYNHIVETEIFKMVMKRLNEEGGIPRGKLQTIVRIRVDGNGAVVDYKIIGSSGNNKMDEAVKESISHYRSVPPPDGKQSTMTIKINSLG